MPDALSLPFLGQWTWFLIGAVLMILELAAPGAFLVWLGLAAAATGLILLAVDLAWPWQTLVFAGLGIVFVVIGRQVMQRKTIPVSDKPFLNRRADAFIGREFTLAEPIEGGVGRVRVDDGMWRVAGADAAAGSRVRVVRVDGSTLVVEAI